MSGVPFITKYKFQKDDTKETRILESVRVGGVFITRIIIQPFAIVGNVYLKETNLVFFAQVGKVKTKFIKIDGTEEKEFEMCPNSGIIHVPPNVAFAIENIKSDKSVVVAFSDRPLHDQINDEPFQVL
jgi:hypothetical protein